MLDITIPGCFEAAGVELDFRRMQLPKNVKHHYGPPLASAAWEMRDIEQGDKTNVDEDREVGHYWLRYLDGAPPNASGVVTAAVAENKRAIDDTREFHEDVFKGNFDKILWIGIGGSGLGPQMLYNVLRKPGAKPTMFFFDNTDPDGFKRTLKGIRLEEGGLEKTLTVVVSKGGSTPETANGMQVAREAYAKDGVSFEKHAVAITQEGSKLHNEAAGWLRRFPLWRWIGGRTSLFSPVGILPATLLGFDVDELRAGAAEMDKEAIGKKKKDEEERNAREFTTNPALQLAATWYNTVETRGLRNMVVLPYCDRLATLSKYLQQLIMESLGKNGKGITVFGNKGSTDQHAYVQQLREGYADFFATFVRVRAVDLDDDFVLDSKAEVTAGDYLAAFQEGTAQALSDAGRPSMRLTIERLDERSLGALVALFERAVGYYGALIGINTYHQPGVETGKKAAGSILDVQQWLIAFLRAQGGAAVSVGDIAKVLKKDSSMKYLPREASLIYDILDRLYHCGRFKLNRDAKGADGIADVKFGIG